MDWCSLFQPAGLFAMGCDLGPQVPGVNFRKTGPAWVELSLDLNYNIRGIVTGDPITTFINIPVDMGMILPDGLETVGVSFDPTDLETGQYTGQIVIASNDPNENYDYIDYTLNVGGGETTRVSILPQEQTVSGDVVFETTIEISDVTNLGSFELTLDFDANYLQANSINLGAFLGSTGRTVFPLTNNINNNTGLIEYAISTFGATLPGLVEMLEFF